MNSEERFLVFDCAGKALIGVLHIPEKPLSAGIVVIGRGGGDRLSILFGRAGAAQGITMFRFDMRGRGDSEGPLIPVDESWEDLGAAIGAFLGECPHVQRVVIFGVSEGAAAALLYAKRDSSVAGLILVNPWIRMDQRVAREHVTQNLSRALHPSFWKRIRTSEDGFPGAAKSLWRLIKNWFESKDDAKSGDLKSRLIESLAAFPGAVQIILSGGDPATAVFQSATAPILQKLGSEGRLTIMTEPDANHVFSRGDWRAHLIEWSLEWTRKLF